MTEIEKLTQQFDTLGKKTSDEMDQKNEML